MSGKCFTGATMDGFSSQQIKPLPRGNHRRYHPLGLWRACATEKVCVCVSRAERKKIDRLVLQFHRERLNQTHLERLGRAIDRKILTGSERGIARDDNDS